MKTTSQYSLIDKMLHRLAFSGGILQKAIADLDSSVSANALSGYKLDRPLFIAGLPRSGTTILLNILNECGVFASASYRDMPFITAPYVWNRITAYNFKANDKTPRAHNDGILINEESPEAFDEVLWKLWFPEKYIGKQIELWENIEAHTEFAEAYKSFALKIIYLRSSENPRKSRFLSKTNGSISRIPILRKLFPDAVILIPYRDPAQHILSLHKQDQHFRTIQTGQPFALRYMNDLGHHEFGLGKKPIAFPELSNSNTCSSLEEWQEYWTKAYMHILTVLDDKTFLFDYDQACRDNNAAISAIFRAANIAMPIDDMDFVPFTSQPKHDALFEANQNCRAVWQQLKASSFNLLPA